MENYTLLFV